MELKILSHLLSGNHDRSVIETPAVYEIISLAVSGDTIENEFI